ncbi:glycosyltransferase [Christiangramia sp. LLG6405-1]|uniref:glycosyltransferase n=1 Tax=Christiangramia sp. LLG6405-1 TaxID=3160832 RepID=UPI003869FB67
MKILQLINKRQNRGAETFACQLSEHLEKMGHEILMVAVFHGDATLPFNGDIQCLHANSSKRFFDLKAWKYLDKIINGFQPDIVQANAGDTLKYAVFSKLVYGWKVPIVFRNASEIGRYLNSILQKKINSYLYRNVDFVASVSKVSENDIIKHFPFLQGKTKVIPIGLNEIDVSNFKRFEPSHIAHIVHVGGFSFEKNHEGLLRILEFLVRENNEVHLHLVGDGPMKKKIELEVKDKNLQSYVSFYGFVHNPLSYIDAADVLVLPSIIEGLPGVLLEAMYCKTPVIAYNVGGIAEIINNSTGIIIQKNEEIEFAHAILRTIEKPDEKMILNAYKMVIENYLNKEIALKFVNSYRKIVAEM